MTKPLELEPVVELLPKNWQYVSLEELGKFDSGGTPSKAEPSYWGGNIPFVTGGDITDFYISARNARTFLTREGLESGKTAICKPGTLMLVTRTGVGRVGIAKDIMGASQDLSPFICSAEVLTEYLCWYLLSISEHLAENARGATIQGITREFIGSLQIPLPPIAEQKRIAAIIQKCDRLRRTRRYTQQLSDTYLQTVFLQMFAETESRNWDLSKLEDLVKGGKNTIRTGPFGSQLLHEEFKPEGDVAVLGIDNVVQNSFAWDKKRFITSQKYQELKRYTVYPGDVLITIMGTCGRCVVAPQNIPLAINTKHLCCITLDQKRCLPTYLQHFFLRHPSALKQLGVSERGAVMPGLNMGLIKELVISLPPLPLQEKFAQIVQRFERLRAQQREADRQAEHLFQTVLHRAFRGEL